MANNNNEFVIDVGAKLDKVQVKQMFNELKTEIDSKKDQISTIKIRVDCSNKQVKESARELQTYIQKTYKSINVGLFDTQVKSLTDFEKRIGLLSNKLKNSGLNELTADFNSIETSINRLKTGFGELKNITDVDEFHKAFVKLKNSANGVDYRLDELIKTERQHQIETSKSESALRKYAQELEKLNQLEVQLAKAKQKSANTKDKNQVASMNNYVKECERSVAAQRKITDEAGKNAEALAGAGKAANVYNNAQQKLAASMAGVNIIQEEQTGLLKSIQNGFKDAISNVSGYALAFGAVGFAIQQLRQSIDVIIELDKTMVDLQIVTNGTRQEIHNMMKEYNQMAIDMGRSTQTVAQSANEFLRMGYSAAESNELIKQSLTLSTLGMIDAADATDYMISAMKGYGVEVQNVSKIIDMATELDMKYSISSGYIMEAMSRTAASAKLAGSEMSNLMAMISIVGETTKKAPEVVGEAMKTMYARYGNVKINKFEDADNPDEVEGINDIERVLNKLGIAIRESGGEWRNYDEVMAEVGERFNQLTDLEQNAVATAMFGTRQRENGIVILTNWNRVLEANEIALNASGSAEERMAHYNEGLGAAIERVGAAWERFLISLGDNSAIINIVNFLADIVELLSNPIIQNILLTTVASVSLAKIASSAHGLSLKLSALKDGLIYLIDAFRLGSGVTEGLTIGISKYADSAAKAGIVTEEMSKKMAAGSASTAKYVASLGKFALAIAAIYAVYKIVDVLNVTYEEHKEKLAEVSAEYQKSNSDLTEVENNLKKIKSRVNELNENNSLTLIEKEELSRLQKENTELERQLIILKDINNEKRKEKDKEIVKTFQSDLTDKLEYTASGTSFNGGIYTYSITEAKYIENQFKRVQELQKLRDKYAQKYDEGTWNNYETITELDRQIEEVKKYLLSKQGEFQELYSGMEKYDNPNSDWQKNYNYIIDYVEQFNDEMLKLNHPDDYIGFKTEQIKSEYSDLIDTLKHYKEVNEDVLNQEQYKQIVDEFKKLGYDIPGIIKELGYGSKKIKENTDGIKDYTSSMTSAISGISDFSEKISSIDDIISNLQSGEALSPDNIKDLIDSYPELTGELYEYLRGQKSESDIILSLKDLRKKAIDQYIDKMQEAYKESSKYLTKIFDKNKILFSDLGLEYDANKNRFVISNIKMAEAAIKYAGVSQEAWIEAANSFLNLPWMTQETNQNGQDSIYISDGELYVHQHNKDGGYHTEVNMGKTAAAIRKDSDESLKELEAERKKIEDSLEKSNKKEKSSKDPWKEAFESAYNDLKHQLSMDYITEQEYYDKLEILNNDYFANKKDYLEDYHKYEEEVYKGRKNLWKKAYDEELDALDRLHERELINDEQYLEEFIKLNDKYFKDNPLYKEEDLKNQDKIYELETEDIKKEYDNWIDLHNNYVEEMDYYNRWSLQQKLNYLAEESAAMERIYGNNLTVYKEYVERQQELQKQMYDTAKELAQQNLDIHDAYLDYVNNIIDKKVQALEEEKEEIEKNNDAREEALKLAELEKKLAESKRNKVLIYRKGKGFVYEQDQTAVNAAQKDVDDYLYEREQKKRIEAIQNEIDSWEDYRDEWNRTVDAYNEEQTRLTALMYDGYVDEKKILQKRTDIIVDYANSYAKAANKVAEANKLINSNIYNMGYDIENGQFSSIENGNKYPGGIGNISGDVKYAQSVIGNSGDTYAILPSGTWVKVNVNDKNKVTDSVPIGSTIVNKAGAWTITGGKAGAYEAKEVKTTSTTTSTKTSSSGGSSRRKVSSSKGSGSAVGNVDGTVTGKNESGSSNVIVKGESKTSEVWTEGGRTYVDGIDVGPARANGTVGTTKNEISMVGEEGRELKILPRGTGIIPNPATETLMKFADNPASFINSLPIPSISSLSKSGDTEIFNVSGITVNANNADEFISSLRTLKNKAIQKTSKRK